MERLNKQGIEEQVPRGNLMHSHMFEVIWRRCEDRLMLSDLPSGGTNASSVVELVIVKHQSPVYGF